VIKESKPNVIVSHPSRVLTAYQAALALQETNQLMSFQTGYYYKKGSWFSVACSLLPNALGLPILRQLQGRSQPGVRGNLVETHALWDVLQTLVSRFIGGSFWPIRTLTWRNARFEKVSAAAILRLRPSAVICYDTAALDSFKACEAVGAVKILDQVIGHLKVGLEVMEEEKCLHPEFFDEPQPSVPDRVVSRYIQEVLSADWIITPSKYVANSLKKIGANANRVIVLPLGVDIQQFQPRVEPRRGGPFRILFMGQIGWRKGVLYLLEAFKQLRLPDAELVLMGSVMGQGRVLTPYEGIFRHVRSVPYSDLPKHYREADVFVFPSLHEGSALVTYEALASGLPIITTENAGSVVQDGEEGLLVPIRDVEALKEAIFTLYRNRELRDRMGHKARQRAEDFTWNNYRRNLAAHVQSFLTNPSPSSLG
jgi:starch synthase